MQCQKEGKIIPSASSSDEMEESHTKWTTYKYLSLCFDKWEVRLCKLGFWNHGGRTRLVPVVLGGPKYRQFLHMCMHFGSPHPTVKILLTNQFNGHVILFFIQLIDIKHQENAMRQVPGSYIGHNIVQAFLGTHCGFFLSV